MARAETAVVRPLEFQHLRPRFAFPHAAARLAADAARGDTGPLQIGHEHWPGFVIPDTEDAQSTLREICGSSPAAARRFCNARHRMDERRSCTFPQGCALGTGSQEACLHTKGGAKNGYGYINAGWIYRVCIVCGTLASVVGLCHAVLRGLWGSVCSPGSRPSGTPKSHMWFLVLLWPTSVLFLRLYACACSGRVCCWSWPPPRGEADPTLADLRSGSRAAPQTRLVPHAGPRSRNRDWNPGRKIAGRECPPTVGGHSLPAIFRPIFPSVNRDRAR